MPHAVKPKSAHARGGGVLSQKVLMPGEISKKVLMPLAGVGVGVGRVLSQKVLIAWGD